MDNQALFFFILLSFWRQGISRISGLRTSTAYHPEVNGVSEFRLSRSEEKEMNVGPANFLDVRNLLAEEGRYFRNFPERVSVMGGVATNPVEAKINGVLKLKFLLKNSVNADLAKAVAAWT